MGTDRIHADKLRLMQELICENQRSPDSYRDAMICGKCIFALGVLTVLNFSFVNAQNGADIYKTYCAGCHGAELQGGLSSKLIKTDWKYGRRQDAIFRNIKFGIPSTEMIGWGIVLTDPQIKAVADFIVAKQTTPPGAPRPIPDLLKTKDYNLKIEKLVTSGLRTPWGIEFTDQNHALITERKGAIRWMVNGRLDPEPIRDVPATYSLSTGGYFDLALDPKYKDNGWIYFAFSESPGNLSDANAKGMTKVVRGKIKDHRWTEQQTLFEVADSLKIPGGNRWGGRLFFDKAGYLYFSIGDMARADDSQDLGKPSGKVFRILPDGKIPKDNPFVGNPKALPAIFSIGNRNVQGFALDPVTGSIFMTEHGPMGGDELNILRKGSNYGWPVITYGIDYSGEIVSKETKKAGMVEPVLQWTPSIAVCPAEFLNSPLFLKWKNNLLVGSLAFEEIRRLVISGNQIEQEIILKGVGRVRDLKVGPDQALYVLLNEPDVVLRIVPVP